MIAIAAPSDEDIQREFKEMLPELSSRLRYRFFEHGPDLQAEFMAEGIALAWQGFLSARHRGKTVTPGSLAWYTINRDYSYPGRVYAGTRIWPSEAARGVEQRRIAADRPLTPMARTGAATAALSDASFPQNQLQVRVGGRRHPPPRARLGRTPRFIPPPTLDTLQDPIPQDPRRPGHVYPEAPAVLRHAGPDL